MVLHQCEPLEIVGTFGDVIKKMDRLSLEDAQNPFLLVDPGPRVDSKRNQVTG